MDTEAAADMVLVDFRTAGGVADWQVVNDDVMGGISRSDFRVNDGVAVFEGEVSLENNGGFASVRSQPGQNELSGYDAFLIRVRGDGRRYKFTVRTRRSPDGPVYQTAFTTKPDVWEDHRLPWRQFVPTFRGRVLAGEAPLDGARVASLGFLISDKQRGTFRLEIAWIKAAKNQT